MPNRKKPAPKVLLEWEYDPVRLLKVEIEDFLDTVHQDDRRLQKSGTPLDYRLTVSKQAAVARHLLNVIRASRANPHREDIL